MFGRAVCTITTPFEIYGETAKYFTVRYAYMLTGLIAGVPR